MYPRMTQPPITAPVRLLALLLALLCLLSALPHRRSELPLPASSSGQFPPEVASALERAPLAFVPNTGQVDPRVRFQAQALGGAASFTAAGVTLALPGGTARPDQTAAASVVRLVFVGARPDVAVEGREQRPGLVNMYLGDDPARWRTGLPTYAAVLYRGLYPGIDLRYDGAVARLKGTYELAPKADPAHIRWRYDGLEQVQLDPASGDLRLTLAGENRTLVERAPVAWQDVAGQRHPVPVRYAVAEDGSIGFAPGAYDSALPLTIDPTLEYSSYLGGSSSDFPFDLVVDASGQVILVGSTASYDFPSKPSRSVPARADTNIFVTKLNSRGQDLVFSTFLGGSREDEARAVALLGDGGVVVAGTTLSDDLPIVDQTIYRSSGGYRDAFVMVLDRQKGVPSFSSYLGGAGYDLATGVAVARSQGEERVLVTGGTSSADFPVKNQIQPALAGVEDVFITEISIQRKTVEFSTLLGGTAVDEAAAIAVDGAGNLVVAGRTESADFPTQAPFQAALAGSADAFVLGLDRTALRLRFSTYLGGAGQDNAAALALDQQGRIYLTGKTSSATFSLLPPLQAAGADIETGSDAFVASLSPDGAALRWSTYFGGSLADAGRDIAIDRNGEVVVTGTTLSTDIPLAREVFGVPGGMIDVFVARLRADGSALLFSTYLGGRADEYAALVAIDPLNNVVVAGATDSNNLPIFRPLQPYARGFGDVFVMRISSKPRVQLSATTTPKAVPPCDPFGMCPTVTITLTLQAVDGALPTRLTLWVPDGMSIQPAALGTPSIEGWVREQEVFEGVVTPGTPLTFSYQAVVWDSVEPGTVLNISARAANPGSAPEVRHSAVVSIPVAVADEDFYGTLVMIYASLDNDLDRYKNELLQKIIDGSTRSDVATLLLLDGAGQADTTLYHLHPRQDCSGASVDCPPMNKWEWPNERMADQQNLTAFVSKAMLLYPHASVRVLSLIGHGGGWSPPVLVGQPSGHGGQPSEDLLAGMLWDMQPLSSLSTPALAQALRDAAEEFYKARGRPAGSGPLLDLLFLDACNMAMAEVAYEVRDSALYMLASANWKWAGFPYDSHIRNIAGDGGAIGRNWLAQEVNRVSMWSDKPFTYALIDLRQIEALRQATDSLAAALMRFSGPLSSTEGKRLLLAAAAAADRYDSNGDAVITVGDRIENADHYVDLGSFSAKLAQTFDAADPVVAQAAQKVSEAVDRAVLSRSARPGRPFMDRQIYWPIAPSASVSIYLPLHYDDWRQRYYYLIASSVDGQWDEAIQMYWEKPLHPSLQHIPPPPPVCSPDACVPPFAQIPLQSLSYLPIVAR